MDEEAPKVINPQASPPNSQDAQNQNQKDSEEKPVEEVKIPRRPGRPPLRGKPRGRQIVKVAMPGLNKEEEIEPQRVKNNQKSVAIREENNLEGFIRIVDYLKKIQCDETSLHNKMNPYNLMTPSCFWFMVSAEYFSFDFFGGKNTHDLALEFLKKAQKTQIILPLRVLKPQKVETELQFENQSLVTLAEPVTDKLVSFIPLPLQTLPENVQKCTHLTTISEDDHFRSSTRAIVFNYIKKKVSNNEKWAASLQPRLEGVKDVTPKQMSFKIMTLEEEFKHEHLDVAPELYYRQLNRRKRDPSKPSNPKKKKSKPKAKSRNRKARRNEKQEDEIFNESQSEDKKQEENQMKEEGEHNEEGENEDEVKEEVEDAEEKENQMQEQNEQGEKEEQQDENMNIIVEEQRQEKQKQEENGMKQDNYMDDEEEDEEMRLMDVKTQDTVYTFQKVYTPDDLLLDSIMHLPIDYVISILQSSINPPQLPQIQRQFLPIPKNDPLELIYQIHPEEEKFLDYMKQRQEKMYLQKNTHSEQIIEEKEREVQVEDAKCQVCTDGDYTDDNLIVFCSMCNISLHQRCVGLTKVPSDNWVCEVCAAFGPAGINVPCPLCQVKGGALKKTSIHISNPLFKDTNPSFHEFSKKCPNFKHKEEYLSKKVGGQDEPYYDYFTKSTYPSDEPVCHYVWVHYVCAIWVPECYFEEKNATINIKGVQNIDKKRFKEKCLICQEVRGGACVKCDNEKCVKYYHPECARKKKVYMEQLNLDKLRYLIFCQAHEPLKVKRKIQVKKKKSRDEIIKFCRGIEKYVQTYKIATLNFKLSKVGLQNTAEAIKPEKKEKCPSVEKVTVKIQRNSDEDFIKSVIEGLTKQNQIVVKITKLSEGRYKVDEVVKPSKREMRKSLTKLNEFWANFKNGQTSENNLRRYNNIMKENFVLKEKVQNFITYGNSTEGENLDDNKKGRKAGRRRRERETIIDQEGGIFCVCRRPYQGQTDMFECEVCNEWYHHECIGFIGSEQDAQSLIFHCMKCLKFESTEEKRRLLEKCGKFFSEDSLFLNYRPPTPSLQSQSSRKVSMDQPPQQLSDRKNEENAREQIPSQHSVKQQQQKLSINMKRPFIIEGPIERDPESIKKPVVSDRQSKQYEMKDESEQKNQQIEKGPGERMQSEKDQAMEQEVQDSQKIANIQIKNQKILEQPIKINSSVNSLSCENQESVNNQTPFFKHASIEGNPPKQSLNAQLVNHEGSALNGERVGPILRFSQNQVHALLKQQKQGQGQYGQEKDEQMDIERNNEE